jgi:hypothetical protein
MPALMQVTINVVLPLPTCPTHLIGEREHKRVPIVDQVTLICHSVCCREPPRPR